MYSNLFSEKSVQDLISILPSLPTALWETFYVTVLSTALSLVIGLPLGVLLVTGEKDGVAKTFYVKNICDHEEAYAETGNQAVSYTTGVPAMIGAAMMLTGKWSGAGVFNMEQLDPDPFMDMLNKHGLPWTVEELDAPLAF